MTGRRWPRWSDDLVKAGFPQSSLLAGTEPAVWNALGRLAPEDFDDGKQVVLRKALDEIGLGWVATNTTPFRIAVGGLFDAAERRQRDGTRSSDRRRSGNGPGSASAPAIDVRPERLPAPDDALTGPVARIARTRANREALWNQLETQGACVIREAVPTSTLKTLPDTGAAKPTKLARTAGNGVAGDPPAVYLDIGEPPAWHNALEGTLGELLIGPGAPGELTEAAATLERRTILLQAGEGAENWAHQDNNDETPPVQAVLMLSEPQKDFTGGEFYVARQTARTDTRIDIVRHEVTFVSAGDLVIFKAGRDSGWWHGMLPVRAGEAGRTGHLRRALGLLQPPGQAR
jgi:hypothetical protein